MKSCPKASQICQSFVFDFGDLLNVISKTIFGGQNLTEINGEVAFDKSIYFTVKS